LDLLKEVAEINDEYLPDIQDIATAPDTGVRVRENDDEDYDF